MNLRKIFSVLALAVGVGLVAWGLTFVHKPQAQALPASTYTDSGKYYDIKVEYPAASAGERAVIEAALGADVADFKQSVADLDPSIMPSLADHKLAFDAEYKSYAAPSYRSYLYTIYEDTGGAHPNGYFKSFVFNERGAQVGITNVLSKNPNALEELSLVVSNDVVAQLKQRLGVDDVTGSIFADGLAAKEENFQNFVVDGDTLVIEIPPYQVAAYAAGSFEVRIPLSDMNK